MANWHQITVVGSDEVSDSVSTLFEALGAVSVTFQDAADEPLYEPPPMSHPLWQKTRIAALFEQSMDLETVRESISKALPGAGFQDWNIELLPDRVWEREWMEHFKAMCFGERFWVCPTHESPPDPNAVNLVLDPGLAFGTGTHPTTALCLEWLSANDLRGLTIVDYGCGSGILSVASVLLGAKNAIAVDIDPQALTATAANAQNNGVADRISCRPAEQAITELADVVIANILAKPLEDLAQVLLGCLRTHGKLVLSGLLIEQATGVAGAYEPRVRFASATIRENWARLDGIKVR